MESISEQFNNNQTWADRYYGSTEVRKVGNIVIITVNRSELDEQICPGLGEEIRNSITPEINQLIFDLSLVKFIDSAGLGILLYGLKRMKNNNRNGQTIICGLQRQLAGVFRLTRMDHVFDFRNSVDDVLRKAGSHVLRQKIAV